MHDIRPPFLSLDGRTYTMNDAFVVTVLLRSPLIAERPLLLESLAAAAVFNRTGKMRDEALAHVPIAVANIAGHTIPMASSHFFREAAAAHPHTIVRRRRRDEIGPEFFDAAPRQPGKDPWEVEQSQGPYLALVRTYETVHAPSVSWVAIGDGEKVGELIRSLGAIGKRRASGFGAIDKVLVERARCHPGFPLLSTTPEAVLRPLPLDVARMLGLSCDPNTAPIAMFNGRHPGWLHPPQLSLMPDPARGPCFTDAAETAGDPLGCFYG